MNRWIFLFASVLFAFVFSMTVNVTINYPTLSNLAVSAFFLIMGVLGFYLFIKPKPTAPTQQVGGQNFTPAPMEDPYAPR